MRTFGKRYLALSLALTATCSVGAQAQYVRIGSFGGVHICCPLPGSGLETRLVLGPANLDGHLTSARFGWSASPCAAAIKIKVFRPSVQPFRWDAISPSFDFVGERGPFDITAPLTSTQFPFIPIADQSVTLDPPLDVKAGDVIAITNLTGCGGPMLESPGTTGFQPQLPRGTFAVPGDVTSSVVTPTLVENYIVNFSAFGDSPAFDLLTESCLSGDGARFCGLARFSVSLTATNPRNGASAIGLPHVLGFAAGYFSLPDFTRDPSFPEITVKMVNATASPDLGGNFWVFHSPLTDLPYVLTVKDQWRGIVRIYSSTPGSPGQLCGIADTNAFPP